MRTRKRFLESKSSLNTSFHSEVLHFFLSLYQAGLYGSVKGIFQCSRYETSSTPELGLIPRHPYPLPGKAPTCSEHLLLIWPYSLPRLYQALWLAHQHEGTLHHGWKSYFLLTKIGFNSSEIIFQTLKQGLFYKTEQEHHFFIDVSQASQTVFGGGRGSIPIHIEPYSLPMVTTL